MITMPGCPCVDKKSLVELRKYIEFHSPSGFCEILVMVRLLPYQPLIRGLEPLYLSRYREIQVAHCFINPNDILLHCRESVLRSSSFPYPLFSYLFRIYSLIFQFSLLSQILSELFPSPHKLFPEYSQIVPKTVLISSQILPTLPHFSIFYPFSIHLLVNNQSWENRRSDIFRYVSSVHFSSIYY